MQNEVNNQNVPRYIKFLCQLSAKQPPPVGYLVSIQSPVHFVYKSNETSIMKNPGIGHRFSDVRYRDICYIQALLCFVNLSGSQCSLYCPVLMEAITPPSIRRSVPVMKPACSPRRKAPASAISSEVPQRSAAEASTIC